MIALVPQRILLMIGDDGLVVVPHGISDASPFFAPAHDKFAAQSILEFIDRYPEARLTLFIDNLAQDYRIEDLPPLNPLDRTKVIARRLKQTFPSARLSSNLAFKNTKNRTLLIGLHESNPAFMWADRLHKRLPDFALLPVEGARIAARLMPEAEEGWAMLISRQRSGGFRQIVTLKGDLIFTRLTPLPPEGDNEAEIIARDIKASLDYLARSGLRDASQLKVLLLATGAQNSAAFEKLSLKSVRFLSPAQAAEQLDLPFAPAKDDPNADLVFAAHLIDSWFPKVSLMLPDVREARIQKAAQTWGMRAAYAGLALALLSTLWRGTDFALTIYDAQKESIQLAKTRTELAQAQSSAAPVTEPLGQLREALERRHIFNQPSATPWLVLNELSAGLDADAQITRLEWKKPGAAPETLVVTLRLLGEAASADRAEAVGAFNRIVQDIAREAPDYTLASVKPPYPALPDEAVKAAPPTTDPMGELTLQGKEP